MSGPLAGIKALDFGAFTVGPAAVSLLALLGADAIRVEAPHLDGLALTGTMVGGIGSAYISSHYSKKNIALDLRSERGKEIGFRLVKWADVLVDNRRLGALERLGFGYEAVSKINPRIIYVSSTAYGKKGPWAHYATADHFVQAASGFASLNGKEGGDAQILRYVAHVDLNASVTIIAAVLMGLLAREITGEGQKIETSHLQAAIAMQASRLAEFFATGVNPQRMGSANSVIVPSQSFKTLDNKYISVSVPREEFWPKLCTALGIEDLQDDPRFESNAQRVKYRKELIPILEEKIGDMPARWWMIHLQRCGVPCGLIYSYEDLIRDPHVQENQLISDLESAWGTIKGTAAPWSFSRTPAEKMRATVNPDQNRDEILEMLGF